MMVDVAIIGAGPAGATAAIELARAGRQVIVLEKKQFPRPKVCGGCLSGPAAARLKQLLGPDRKPPGIPGSQVTFVIGSYRLTCESAGATWMVARAEMDAALADAAGQAGADIRYGSAATIEQSQHGWDVVVGEDRIRAGWVLIAAGLSCLPAKMGIRNSAADSPMIAQQWTQPARALLPSLGCVELHWLRSGYVGLATTHPSECCVAIACDAPEGPDESAYERLRRLNPDASLWNVLPADAPRRYGARGTAGFPWVPDRLGHGNALLIGDGAGYAEPYSGEGIGQAMCSASCAAQAILAGGDVLATYARLIRRFHGRIVRRTRWVRAVLRSPLVHYVASKRPVLPRPWLTSLVERVHVTGTL